MQKLLTILSDTFFPPTPTQRSVRDCSPHIIQLLYIPGVHKQITYLSSYSESLIQAAITENKFHHYRPAADFLSKLLEHWLRQQPEAVIIVPVPLGKARQRERGYNQVEEIVRRLEKKVDIRTNLLKRKVDTPPQTSLTRSTRLNNVKGAFRCQKEKVTVLNKRVVVLLDDVATTGATLAEARATLAPHLPTNTKLICLAIAH